MSTLRLDQLSIRLRGVSRPIAEAAMDGLGQELGRRLARTPLSTLPVADIGQIDLSGTDFSEHRDATALREAIAHRIVAGLTDHRLRVGAKGGRQ